MNNRNISLDSSLSDQSNLRYKKNIDINIGTDGDCDESNKVSFDFHKNYDNGASLGSIRNIYPGNDAHDTYDPDKISTKSSDTNHRDANAIDITRSKNKEGRMEENQHSPLTLTPMASSYRSQNLSRPAHEKSPPPPLMTRTDMISMKSSGSNYRDTNATDITRFKAIILEASSIALPIGIETLVVASTGVISPIKKASLSPVPLRATASGSELESELGTELGSDLTLAVASTGIIFPIKKALSSPVPPRATASRLEVLAFSPSPPPSTSTLTLITANPATPLSLNSRQIDQSSVPLRATASRLEVLTGMLRVKIILLV
jgi:hypothetical protein